MVFPSWFTSGKLALRLRRTAGIAIVAVATTATLGAAPPGTLRRSPIPWRAVRRAAWGAGRRPGFRRELRRA